MTTASWISLIAMLATVLGMVIAGAAVWGALKNQVGNLSTSLTELRAEFNRSSERQGERIGKLERAVDVSRAVRRATKGIPTEGEPK